MSEEWGPWIEHDGSGCPVPVGTVVHRVFDETFNIMGGEVCGPTKEIVEPVRDSEILSWLKEKNHALGRIPLVIRYRIRKPKGLSILERIASQPQERVEA